MKKCNSCGELKPYTEFDKNKRNKDGYCFWCKNCHKQYNKQYYHDNKEKLKQYYHDNKDKIKQYRIDNKEKINEYNKNQHGIRKKLIESFKENCAICGFKDKPALVFHHRDPKEKKFNIASIRKLALEPFQEEITKCVVLCANCHFIFHYYDNNPSERPKFLLKKYLELGLTIRRIGLVDVIEVEENDR